MTFYEFNRRATLKTLPAIDAEIEAEWARLIACRPGHEKDHAIKLAILRRIREELQTPTLNLFAE